MIAADQPANLPEELLVAVSSREDGTMLDRSRDNRHDVEIVANRKAFCDEAGVNYENCAYQIISYNPEATFRIITEVSGPNTEGVAADVLYTEKQGIGLFLPIADCVGTIIYDPKRHALALAHLGRHASLADTLTKTIEFFIKKGSKAEDLHIWMAPSVKQQSYRMEYFDKATDQLWKDYCLEKDDGFYLDMQGYNQSRAIAAGVPAENITVSPVDTATSEDYFSHSQGDQHGRFAVVAELRTI
jgi:copper oxidase (laccase) domain-containing protein